MRTQRTHPPYGVTAARVARLLFAALVSAALPGAASVSGDEFPQHERSDLRARNAIFTESILADNVRAVHDRAVRLDDDDRYRFLAAWVLPVRSHQSFRFAGWFTQTHPLRVSASDDPVSSRHLAAARERDKTRIEIGGTVMSPVLDLIHAAQQIGRLDTLRKQVESISSQDEYNTRCRAALLALIEIKSIGETVDIDRAARWYDELYRLVESSGALSFDRRWPETIVASAAIEVPRLREFVREMLTLLNVQQESGGSDVWDNHILALIGRSRSAGNGSNPYRTMTADLQHWHSVSRVDSTTRGSGRPTVRWAVEPEAVRAAAGHGLDYLYFQIPLTGNYEVECEVSSYSFAMGHLLVAGRWLMVQNESSLRSGVFRANGRTEPIDPPLSKLDLWSRYRVVVRDGLRSTFFNGRPMNGPQQVIDSEPWLAIRNIWSHTSGVRNVRITGDPVIPDEIPMLADHTLSGWMPYYAYDRSWQHAPEFEGGGVIGGQDKQLPPGSDAESLLYYQRPLLEDGAIEYDFFYEPGATEVHPALDRLAFLLQPDGVRVHELTDSHHDPAAIDPANVFEEPASQTIDGPLPLRVSDWNHVSVSIVDRTVELSLNGPLVFRRTLEPTNSRAFGLFHYLDRTEARVRNLVWRGAWPKQLPSLDQQSLASPDHACLADLDRFKEVSTTVFQQQVISPTEYELLGDNVTESIEMRADGLHVTCMDRDQWHGLQLRRLKPVYGDFDATLRFHDLQTRAGSKSSVGLAFNAIEDGSEITAGASRTNSANGRDEASARLITPLPDGTRRYDAVRISDQSAHSRLRLVRLGRTVNMLIAHGDSPNWHSIGSQSVRSAASGMTLQILLNNVGNGASSVVLDEFVLRSNSAATEQRRDPRVNALDQYTLDLSNRHDHEFATGGLRDFTVSSEQQCDIIDSGLRMRTGSAQADQTQVQESVVSAAFNRAIEGDFDVATSIDILHLPTADATNNTVELICELADSGDRAAIIVRRKDDATLHIQAVAERGSGANRKTRVIAEADSTSVDGLRLIRIQQTLFCLFSEDGIFRLLDTTTFDAGRVNFGGIRLSVRGTSSGGEIDVNWKFFESRAAGFDG